MLIGVGNLKPTLNAFRNLVLLIYWGMVLQEIGFHHSVTIGWAALFA
jgi:hypothetical protein